MMKIPQPLKIIANLSLLLIILLNLLFITQQYTRPYISLPLYLQIKAIFPAVMLICYILFVPALLVANPKAIYKIILAVFIIPLFCITGLVMLDTEYLLNTAQVGNVRYNLVVVHQIGDNITTCQLYRCDAKDLACHKISSFVGQCGGLEKSDLIINSTTNEVNVFLQNGIGGVYRLDYTYGIQPRSYTDKIQFGEYDYYLAYFHDYDSAGSVFKSMLYRCIKNDTTCHRLPFQYNSIGWLDLEIDNQTGEIKIFVKNKLIYTFGSSPKCYVEECSITDN